ncbi:MAG: glycosyltransferase family 4 protein [Acidimicrobiales bacterium]
MIFQLGTNNWQRGGEFAPGSGILHEAHHHAYNAMLGVASYSMYPSSVQRSNPIDEEQGIKVFELEHDIPICESVSPVSSYRWHSMSDQEFAGYRERLTTTVATWMEKIEAQTGRVFTLAVAHHAFLNPVVMRDVLRSRELSGKSPVTLLCFAHGTALKMYTNERAGLEDFPTRFSRFIEDEGVFSFGDPRGHVDVCAAISLQQVEAVREAFPEFPSERILLSPNGYNDEIFTESTAADYGRAEVLAELTTVDGRPLPVSADKIVVFCGKFADWKRIDALLHAAASYEEDDTGIVTLIVGSGPDQDKDELLRLAYGELGLERTFFVGPKAQTDLARVFAASDVGCFPSRDEPFGLVFIECMASGTPVIGVNSGGPRDFVTNEVGALVPETTDRSALALSLAAAVREAIADDWKTTKGADGARMVRSRFSIASQTANLLAEIAQLPPGVL